MSLALAARRALTSLDGPDRAAVDAAIEQVTLHVRVEGRLEVVSVSLTDGRLICRSSDGAVDGPHVRAALAALAAGDAAPHALASSPPDKPPSLRATQGDVSEHLEHLVTTVARIGVDRAAVAPAVEDAIDRLLARVPGHLPLARLLGRLREALCVKDVGETARLLEGLSRRAESLEPFAPAPSASLHARRMVEVGREWLAAPTRAAIQRRYLVDLDSGEVYCEDRRPDAAASVGPCPRRLEVGLARVVGDAHPIALEMLQYEVTPRIDAESRRALEVHVHRDFDALLAWYRRTLDAAPGEAEPFALVAPTRVDHHLVPALIDASERVLPIDAEDRGVVSVFAAACASCVPSWVAGRLVEREGVLRLDPVALALGSGEHLRLR